MYKYNENTLIHSAGVNFNIIESIMKNGISSEKYGHEHNIEVNRNYKGSNLDDTISCVRALYVNKNIEDSAYSRYVKTGVSFIIENTPFINDKNERIIHRSDEVLVPNFIPKENIKGINIPSSLINTPLEELSYFRVGTDEDFYTNKKIDFPTSYENIKKLVDSIKKYIKEKSGLEKNYDDYYNDLYYTNELVKKEKDILSKNELFDLYEDFRNCLIDLNYEIGNDFHECFSIVLKKDDITVLDIVNYINNETLNLPIYEIETRSKGKGR